MYELIGHETEFSISSEAINIIQTRNELKSYWWSIIHDALKTGLHDFLIYVGDYETCESIGEELKEKAFINYTIKEI